MRNSAALDRLRAEIGRLERRSSDAVLPFGDAALDAVLPGGGLARAALHEAAGAGEEAEHGAAAALFLAGVAARTEGPVLWCARRADLFPPALAQAGLAPDRVVYVAAADDAAVLACLEEGLRHGGLGAAVGELARLPMVASRRLQLAAETGGTLGLVLRRWRRAAEARAFAQPTAAATRWRIAVLPAAPLPVPGVGRPRWRLELVRCRGGEAAAFDVEACDGAGRLAVLSDLGDRPAAARGPRAVA